MNKELLYRKELNAYRTLNAKSDLSDFCSNDYLGFSKSKEFIHEGKFNMGAGGSRLLSGDSLFHHQLEDKIAAIHKTEAALFFNSGYTANVGFFSTIPKKGDTVIYDELIHASIRDGLKMSLARSFSFRHNDMSDLQEKLSRLEGTIFVVTEAIFSMDGDQAPLKEISKISNDFEANLVVDEAHSVGIYGEKGEGLVHELDLDGSVFARIITYGKAFGFHGAAIIGSELLKDYLVNYCRSFIYTTAPSIHDVNTVLRLYNKMAIASIERARLVRNITLFKSNLGLENESNSPIQIVIIPGNTRVRSCSLELAKKGFDVRAVLSPTVPVGTERLRICIHSFNTEEEIIDLTKSIAEYLQNH